MSTPAYCYIITNRDGKILFGHCRQYEAIHFVANLISTQLFYNKNIPFADLFERNEQMITSFIKDNYRLVRTKRDDVVNQDLILELHKYYDKKNY